MSATYMISGLRQCFSMHGNACKVFSIVTIYTKQKHLGCKKGEANQKQQLSDYRCIRT